MAVVTSRDKNLSRRSIAGNTGSAIVATGDARRVPNEYARGHVHFFHPYLYRSEFLPRQKLKSAPGHCHLRRIIESEAQIAYRGLFPWRVDVLRASAGGCCIVATLGDGRRRHCMENAATIGNGVLGEGLNTGGETPIIGEVRGSGVFWALTGEGSRNTLLGSLSGKPM